MNMQKLLKQAQEMQEKMQRELADTTVEASVGGGMVKVQMDGHKQLRKVDIDPAVGADDLSMLEDLILAAVNEASRKVDDSIKGRVGSLASNMPNLF